MQSSRHFVIQLIQEGVHYPIYYMVFRKQILGIIHILLLLDISNLFCIEWLRSETNKTITLPLAYSVRYLLVGSLCRNYSGWQSGAGVVNFGEITKTKFKCAVITDQGSYNDICNIITIGY